MVYTIPVIYVLACALPLASSFLTVKLGIMVANPTYKSSVTVPSRPAARNNVVRMAKKGGGGGGELQKVLERYEAVIGVEVHAQLLSPTKAYCRCSTKYNPTIPNVNICPVCTGEPGTLPLPNLHVIELANKAAMALNCRIAPDIRYDRKNYFYPDTPKNYQITQYAQPVGEHGELELPSGKIVRITRLHMEEDSAKMLHQGADSLAGSTYSLVDMNRAGIPLVEVVSEPDMRSGSEAAEYGRELQKVLRYVGASDGNMAEGSMRLDINVSIRPKGDPSLRPKVEIKNVNSFKSVQQAVDFEVLRQAKAYDEVGDGAVRQETRMWDEKDLSTKIMRVKEGESDYRYFPEPDIPVMALPSSQLEQWRSELGELPAAKRKRYQEELGLDADSTKSLTEDLATVGYFEEALVHGADPKEAAKWLTGDIAGYMNNPQNKGGPKSIGEVKLRPAGLSELVGLIKESKITGKIAKELLPDLLSTWEGGVLELVKERGMEAISDPAVIEAMVRKVMEAHADKVTEFRAGKTKMLGFFVGMVLKESGSKADPQIAQVLTERLLNES